MIKKLQLRNKYNQLETAMHVFKVRPAHHLAEGSWASLGGCTRHEQVLMDDVAALVVACLWLCRRPWGACTRLQRLGATPSAASCVLTAHKGAAL